MYNNFKTIVRPYLRLFFKEYSVHVCMPAYVKVHTTLTKQYYNMHFLQGLKLFFVTEFFAFQVKEVRAHREERGKRVKKQEI